MPRIILESPFNLCLSEATVGLKPTKNQALVQTRRVGICGTDLHSFQGNFPFMEYPRILGHELCVEILELGELDTSEHGLRIGDICALEPYLECGICGSCNSGRYNCCEKLNVIGVHSDGGMTDQLIVPVRKLHPGRGVSENHLAIVEMLAVGAHAISRAGNLSNQSVLVIGVGPIGLGIANFAKIAGAKVTVVDSRQKRLDFATKELEIDGILADDRLLDRVMDSMGELPTTVFEATGNKSSMDHSFKLVAHGGQLVFVGLVRDMIEFDNPDFHSREMTLKSSRNATSSDFQRVIASLQDGSSNVDAWITHQTNPRGLIDDMNLWISPETGVIKGLVNWDEI